MYVRLQCLLLAVVLAQTDDEDIDVRIEKENANFDDSQRRFMDNLNDEEWHVAHLKATDFENTRRSGCKEETLSEKIKRYRKTLSNDPGRIKYVYAQALPFDEKDLDEKCGTEDAKDGKEKVQSTSITPSEADISVTTQLKGSSDDPVVAAETGAEETAARSAEIVSEATRVIKLKPIPNARLKPRPEVKDTATTTKPKGDKAESMRRGDYLFSSAEYDEDVVDFNESECPGDVEVIELELDMIRSYDVECELSLEWLSLT